MKIRSSKVIGLVLLAFFLACVAFGSAKVFSLPGREFLIGQKLRENKNLSNKDQIIMVVNGVEVTKKDFEDQRALLSFTLEAVPDNVVRDKIIEKIVLFEEAKKRGLIVSLEEAKQYAQKMKKESISSYVDNPELVKNYIQGQGLTIDEFFDTIAPPLYQKALSIGKLRAQVYDEVAKNLDPNITIEQKMAAQKDAFDNLTKELKDKAIVKYPQ